MRRLAITLCCLDFLTVFLAVTWIGAVVAPLNPAFTALEQRFHIEDGEARAVIVPPVGAAAAQEAASSLGVPVWEARLGTDARFAVPIVQAYGMTEASHQMASNPPPPRTRKPGSDDHD